MPNRSTATPARRRVHLLAATTTGAFALGLAGGVAMAGPIRHTASDCSSPSMAIQEDNITPGLYGNVWDSTTSPCAANEQVSRGAAAILWGPSGVCRTSDWGWDGTLEGLPDTIPVAGASAQAGWVTREQLIESLGDDPLDLTQLSDGKTIQRDVIGPTQDGALGPIGTQACTVHHDDTGAPLTCGQEVPDDRALPFPVTPTTP